MVAPSASPTHTCVQTRTCLSIWHEKILTFPGFQIPLVLVYANILLHVVHMVLEVLINGMFCSGCVCDFRC